MPKLITIAVLFTVRLAKRFDQAIEDFDKAIELNSELAIAYLNRGQTWLNLHEWEKASADLNIAKNKGI